MSGFPSLKPAITLRVKVGDTLPVGSFARGTPLAVVVKNMVLFKLDEILMILKPMVEGTLISEPGFEPSLDAKLAGGAYDFIRADPDGGHMRLDVRSQFKLLVAMYYKGVAAVTPDVQKVLSGAADAKTTDYGHSFITVEFETGSEKYKALETAVFAAAGHFVLEDGAVSVEYKLSQVV
ncbi:hypothetical protein PV08_08793 [Exophiala spinifera]|uniref:Uncharacterized protein n=1 Tax=Exophiala spinifera TaxID=91928 RepID=A0A0D2B3W8_9EURO|nr:uncharacterized protein PV08_08793 [Exophiala spinifera]KIW13603.1 hypothetical protein PV08_08793 [Exophiala spinifera]